MAKKKGKKFTVHGSPVKKAKFKGHGSPVESPSKKVVKRSMKKKKRSLKIKVASTPPDGLSSKSMLVADVATTAIVASSSTIAHDNGATPSKKKEKESMEQTSGFIFMCNGKTKPECYRNRVFGLPRGQLEILEKIKPGTKLFLFDFDLKLLYGIYMATSKGELCLEPTAFDGKFPAQVRFKIFKECLPLAEKAFKHAIKENYKGSKFRQDLASKQVEALISLFRPIRAPTSASGATTVANVVTPHRFPAPVMEERFQLQARLPPPSDSYLSGLRQGHALQVPVLPSEQVITQLPYDQHGTDTHLGNVKPLMELQHTVQQAALPHRTEPYYLTEAHQPYLPDKPSLSVLDPYGRYSHTLEVVRRDRIAGYGSKYQTSQRMTKIDIAQHSENVVNYYSQNLPPASALHAPLRTHAPAALASYQPYFPITPNENLRQAYAIPVQRPASGRSSLVEASLSTDAQGGLLSSYQPHYPVASNENIHRTYTDPLQRPVSVSTGLVDPSFPVSSHYSLPGAAPTYH